MLRTFLSLCTLFVLLAAAPASAQDRPAGLDARIAEFERRTGLDLHLFGDRTEPAPAKVNDDLGPVDPALALAMLPVIEKALLAYPPRMRGGLVTDVHLFGKLRMRGKPFLGAARPSLKRIDLAIRPGTKEGQLLSTLHHELSHLIEGHPAFPKEEWLALSDGYTGRGISRDSRGDAKVPYDRGYVSHYASVNRHEDFAELAEVAFTQPGRLRDLASKYERLEDKVVLLTAIYRHVLPKADLPWLTDDLIARCDALSLPALGGAAPRRVARDDNGNPLPRG
jgi:hypothetical protein